MLVADVYGEIVGILSFSGNDLIRYRQQGKFVM